MDYVYCPMANQSLGIMQPMNPIVDSLIPSNAFAPVENMQPYLNSQQIGSVQDALQVLQVTDMLFG